MLSYRHAFHAGNHADVLKHIVLALCLDYLKQKEKPIWYIDTHAGAGCYALTSSEARKNAEHNTGITPLLAARAALPLFLAPFWEVIDQLRSNDQSQLYPGSPLFAAQLLRAQDRLRLFEMHPQDAPLLQQQFVRDRRVVVASSDGFAGMKALLPPPSRRGLVLIDPPYELKEDYRRVVTALQQALSRFSTGTYAVWYPLLNRTDTPHMAELLNTLQVSSLRVELNVRAPEKDFGMYGSGMFIINPPWLLHDQLKVLMPQLQMLLAKSGAPDFILQYSRAIA